MEVLHHALYSLCYHSVIRQQKIKQLYLALTVFRQFNHLHGIFTFIVKRSRTTRWCVEPRRTAHKQEIQGFACYFDFRC